MVHWDFVAPGKLFSAQPPLAIASLQQITAGARTDDEAWSAVTRYYEANADTFAARFNETNPQRLKGLFAMYVIHTSHPYGVVEHQPDSFLAYLQQPLSHCGTYSYYQAELLKRLGVSWRIISISGGTHEFVEAQIDDHWEVFDATINVWIDTSAFEMERGAPRRDRKLYTPLLDVQATDTIESAPLRAAQELRQMMPGLGVFFFPKAYLSIEAEG